MKKKIDEAIKIGEERVTKLRQRLVAELRKDAREIAKGFYATGFLSSVTPLAFELNRAQSRLNAFLDVKEMLEKKN